jgi:molybdopterin biosynthesis enzyme
MSDSSLSISQALTRWFVQVLIFIIAGGVAAGASSLVYETISTAENNVVVYGVVFAGAGWIAYQLSRRVLDR